jgi:FkbM family methyltransferase
MPSDRTPAAPWSILGAPARALRPLAYRLRTRPRLGRLALRLVPNAVVRVRIEGIGPFLNRLRQHRSFWLRDPMVTERVPFALLRALARPGDVVYDVGANIGLYTRLLSTLGVGEVVAFEPVAANRALYRRNVALGRIAESVRCLAIALSDRDEEAEFQLDDMQSTSGTLDRVTGGAPSEGRRNLGLAPRTERVACRRLDSLVSGGEIPPPDLMKLDVEGAEALVLRGGLEVLRRHRPRLLVELHGAEVARQVAGLLLDLGYTCRGAVVPELDPSGFAPVTRELLPRVRGLYDLHFLAASMDPADLPEQV